MKISIEVSEQNEATRCPWWAIISPKQNFSKGEDGINAIASMITGPFFSRAEAESVLESQRYNFGRRAVVYCLSGHQSPQYSKQINF
jgi:hypothetical protein